MTINDTTIDDFLGGALQIEQPAKAYRAGMDPVLLVAAVMAKKGDHFLDVGCGVGTAGLCLARRVPGVRVTGVDLTPGFVMLAQENAVRNQLTDVMDFVVGNVGDLPRGIKDQSFDGVISNPPFFDPAEHRTSPDPLRAVGRTQGDVALSDWVRICVARVKSKGVAGFIVRTDRMVEMIAAMEPQMGDVQILPLWSYKDQPAKRVIVTGRKGIKTKMQLLPGLVLHNDNGDLSDVATAILRDGKGTGDL